MGSAANAITLGELSVRYGLELSGDPGLEVDGVAALASATPGTLSFCSSPKYRRQLAATRATAVVLAREMLPECPVDPVLHFAHALFERFAQATGFAVRACFRHAENAVSRIAVTLQKLRRLQ